jgi:hypothetical protein
LRVLYGLGRPDFLRQCCFVALTPQWAFLLERSERSKY